MDMVKVTMPMQVAVALQQIRSVMTSEVFDTHEKAEALLRFGTTVARNEQHGTIYIFEKNLVDGLQPTRAHVQLESEGERETETTQHNTTTHSITRVKILKSMACRFAMNEDETIDAALEAFEYLVDVAGCQPTRAIQLLSDALPEGWTWTEVGEMVEDINAQRDAATNEANELAEQNEVLEGQVDALESEVEDLKERTRWGAINQRNKAVKELEEAHETINALEAEIEDLKASVR